MFNSSWMGLHRFCFGQRRDSDGGWGGGGGGGGDGGGEVGKGRLCIFYSR